MSLLRRHPDAQPTGKCFLIVCEGEKTEPFYFRALCTKLRLSTASVQIVHPSGTDPMTLVEEARKLMESRKRQARTEEAVIPYDEVWVVSDLEETHDVRRAQLQSAITEGLKRGIHFAKSDPAFEFWLLLHETFTTRPFADCVEVIRQLETFWPGYKKSVDPGASFIEKLPVAVRNAERCRKHHLEVQGDGNPSTDVDILVRSLNESTRYMNRFALAERTY